MRVLEKTKEEVVSKAGSMSDFLRMEYLELCSESIKDLETLKYCYSELARLYENWIMYTEALKYLAYLKSITVYETEKFKIYEKEIEIFIKSGNYERVDNFYKDAIKLATSIKAYELRRKIVDLFLKEANKLELGKKYSALARLYERLLPFLADIEKNEIKKKLALSYEKLGKVRESISLEREIMR